MFIIPQHQRASTGAGSSVQSATSSRNADDIAFRMKPPTPHRSTPTHPPARSREHSFGPKKGLPRPLSLPSRRAHPNPKTEMQANFKGGAGKTSKSKRGGDTAEAKRKAAAAVRASRLEYGRQVRAMNQPKK